jgi:hypothetical protein
MIRPRAAFDERLRRQIYRHLIGKGKAPIVAELAKALSAPVRRVTSGLQQLVRTHAFVLQDSGELWRAAPFSAVPTAFPVRIGKRSWWGNCIWDALGIPAMLKQDARIDTSCGCCNSEMTIDIAGGKLLAYNGLIHVAVPARDWYEDIVFT